MTKVIVTRVFLWVMAMALCFDVRALIVEDLYSTTVTVADKSEKLRRQAVEKALSDVLVKLTGSRRVLRDPGVLDILSQAQRYVVEYGYVDQTSSAQSGGLTEQQSPDDVGMTASVKLNVRFEARAVQIVLRDLLLPIWPADRPVVMIWVVTNTSKGKQFIEFADDGNVSADVKAALKRRGIPFKSPLYDLEDRMALTAQQAWQGSDEFLTGASRRYGIDHWLVLAIANNEALQPSQSNAQGRWFLGGRVESSSGSISAQSQSQLVDDAIAEAIDQLSQSFTYQAGQLGEAVHLLITGIHNYQDFSGFTSLLKSFEVVESSQVTRVEKDHLYLDLVTEGDAEVLLKALNGNSQLSRVVDMGDSLDQALYRFQWRAGNQ
jgi:hypothetical protein